MADQNFILIFFIIPYGVMLSYVQQGIEWHLKQNINSLNIFLLAKSNINYLPFFFF